MSALVVVACIPAALALSIPVRRLAAAFGYV